MTTQPQHRDACPECGEIVPSSGMASGIGEELNQHATCPNGHKLIRAAGGGEAWRLDDRP